MTAPARSFSKGTDCAGSFRDGSRHPAQLKLDRSDSAPAPLTRDWTDSAAGRRDRRHGFSSGVLHVILDYGELWRGSCLQNRYRNDGPLQAELDLKAMAGGRGACQAIIG